MISKKNGSHGRFCSHLATGLVLFCQVSRKINPEEGGHEDYTYRIDSSQFGFTTHGDKGWFVVAKGSGFSLGIWETANFLTSFPEKDFLKQLKKTSTSGSWLRSITAPKTSKGSPIRKFPPALLSTGGVPVKPHRKCPRRNCKLFLRRELKRSDMSDMISDMFTVELQWNSHAFKWFNDVSTCSIHEI